MVIADSRNIFFAGAETGGIEEISSTSGTVSSVTTNPRSGAYCYELAVGATARFILVGGSSRVLHGFAVYINSSLPSSVTIIAQSTRAGVPGTITCTIQLDPAGHLAFVDSIPSTLYTTVGTLSVNKWYYIEFSEDGSSSSVGFFRVRGDNIDESSGPVSANFAGVLGGATLSVLGNTSGDVIRYDDIYSISPSTELGTNFPGPCSVLAYQSGNTTATSDAGNNLNTGVWNNTGKTPVETATTRASFTTTNSNGQVILDDAANGGRGLGPSSGEYQFTTPIYAVKVSAKMFRGSGSASTFSLYICNNRGTPYSSHTGNSSPSLTTSPTFQESYDDESGGSGSIAPLASDKLVIGFGTSGAQDVLVDEMWGMILIGPQLAQGGRPDGITHQRQMLQLLSI